MAIRAATPGDIAALAALTVEAVSAGASIHFTADVDLASAARFWAALLARDAVTLVAEDSEGLAGTVTVGLDTPPNQQHRAEVQKMIVALRARRGSLGAALLAAAEVEAAAHGRWLLTLDTVTGGDAERLYARGGWQRCGQIDDYAFAPDGTLCATTLFSKRLAPR